MAYEELCMYCFEERGDAFLCPHCGRDNRAAVPQIQMLPGSTVYHDRFLVGRALGQDATGIVYSAYDTKREARLRLREYLPRDCAERLNDGSIVPVAGMEDAFEAGLKKLRASVEGVEDPRKRHFFFEENGTAYIAQRTRTAESETRDDDDDEHRRGIRRIAIVVGIAMAVVLVAAIVIVSMINGMLDSANDITVGPSFNPSSTAWAPIGSPSPTPYATATFAPLVDPEQSWMDYTYPGDVEQEFHDQDVDKRTPVPTFAPSSGYGTISAKSSAAEIRGLQQRLVSTGWLSYDRINGVYDSQTKQAVRDFQNYVNTHLNPQRKLSVDGIAGPQTQQWLYMGSAVKPTAAPTPMITARPSDSQVVDKNSSKADIRSVQRKLIILSLMKPGSDDGIYGSTTTTAVKKFQQRVNEIEGFVILPISGVVDPLTMAYLNYYVEWWQDIQDATPTPTVKPTPTPAPTGGTTVDADSTPQEIRYLQRMLIAVGLLKNGDDSGVYGSETISAVAKFQEWANGKLGRKELSVSGIGDPLTMKYLELAYSSGMIVRETPEPTQAPTAAPTPAPTEVPTAAPDQDEDIVVDPASPPESIAYVQEMLISVGLLPQGASDGIYGRSTTEAVRSFQNYINSRHGAGTVSVTGLCDAITLNYLEDYAGSGVLVVDTPEPTQKPQINLRLSINGVESDEVIEVFDDSAEIAWQADGDVDSYYVYITDGDGQSVYTEEATTSTRGTIPADVMISGMVYTVRIGALPVDGTEQEMVWASARFGIDLTEPEEPTEEPAAPVGDVSIVINGRDMTGGLYEIEGERCEFQWFAEGNVQSYIANIVDENGKTIAELKESESDHASIPVSTLEQGVIYTLNVGARPMGGSDRDIVWGWAQFILPANETPEPAPTEAPTEEPTSEPTPEPTPEIGEIGEVTILINDQIPDGTVQVEGEYCRFQWNAEGDVQSYTIYFDDENGQRIMAMEDTDQTSIEIPAANMTPGLIYEISVGAMPVNGSQSDMVWRSARFTVPKEEPTPQPTVAPVSAPQINIDGTAYSQDGIPYLTGETVIFSWMSDGAVECYSVYISNSAGQNIDLGRIVETSRTVEVASLAPDVYRIYVGAVPMGATSDSDIVWNDFVFGIPSPEITEAPVQPTMMPEEEWPVQLDQTSLPEDVQKVQMKLYMLGILDTMSAQIGVLDIPTLESIAMFQQRINELYDAQLIILVPDPLTAVVDTMTLQYLYDATPEIFITE
ncbi:MAG: peptidoglycan-binding protein [Christensenellales bacterium]|nr:peptidoglycan-binding protein [Christensenellales bacterium]